jgi:hypothetical protein
MKWLAMPVVTSPYVCLLFYCFCGLMVVFQGIGQARNLSTLDSDRLAFHSSRVSKTGSHARSLSLLLSHIVMRIMVVVIVVVIITITTTTTTIMLSFLSDFIFLTNSEIHIPRNISCPVSPVGSPLLHSRSPQHLNGRMSPSPISSPRTTSGSSTPLTGGSNAIPFNHLKQSQSGFLQEGFGGMQKAPNGFFINGPSYHESSPDIFRGMQPGSNIFSELAPSENNVLGKQFGRPAHGELYDGQSVLADRVSRQLLRDNNVNPSLDLSSSSSLPSHSNGI